MSTRHTPGPWKVIDFDEGGHEIRMGSRLASGFSYEPQHSITYDHGLYSDELQYAEADANARLMAAAPELLEACQRMMGLDDTCDYREPEQASDPADCPGIAENDVACHWCFMRAAIAKATGGAS